MKTKHFCMETLKNWLKKAVYYFNKIPSSWGEGSHIEAMMESRRSVERRRSVSLRWKQAHEQRRKP